MLLSVFVVMCFILNRVELKSYFKGKVYTNCVLRMDFKTNAKMRDIDLHGFTYARVG